MNVMYENNLIPTTWVVDPYQCLCLPDRTVFDHTISQIREATISDIQIVMLPCKMAGTKETSVKFDAFACRLDVFSTIIQEKKQLYMSNKQHLKNIVLIVQFVDVPDVELHQTFKNLGTKCVSHWNRIDA